MEKTSVSVLHVRDSSAIWVGADVTRLPEVLRSLSERARNFPGITVVNDGIWQASASAAPEIESRWNASPEARHVAERFDGEYGGLKITFLGGSFEGEVVLGVTGPEAVWRSQQGVEMFKCASHPTLQCAIVSAVDRRLGCSWSREFSPLFDSVALLIEDAAMWGSVQGWSYAAAGAFPVEIALEEFPDLIRDDSASGGLLSWWVSPEVVTAAHQYLSPGRSTHLQVAVLVKTSEAKELVRRALRKNGISELLYAAGEMHGIVPKLVSEV